MRCSNSRPNCRSPRRSEPWRDIVGPEAGRSRRARPAILGHASLAGFGAATRRSKCSSPLPSAALPGSLLCSTFHNVKNITLSRTTGSDMKITYWLFTSEVTYTHLCVMKCEGHERRSRTANVVRSMPDARARSAREVRYRRSFRAFVPGPRLSPRYRPDACEGVRLNLRVDIRYRINLATKLLLGAALVAPSRRTRKTRPRSAR